MGMSKKPLIELNNILEDQIENLTSDDKINSRVQIIEAKSTINDVLALINYGRQDIEQISRFNIMYDKFKLLQSNINTMDLQTAQLKHSTSLERNSNLKKLNKNID